MGRDTEYTRSRNPQWLRLVRVSSPKEVCEVEALLNFPSSAGQRENRGMDLYQLASE